MSKLKTKVHKIIQSKIDEEMKIKLIDMLLNDIYKQGFDEGMEFEQISNE